MKNISFLLSGFILASAFLLQGCASGLHQSQSGFLKDYSQLKPSDKYKNTKIYVSSSFNKKAFSDISSVKLEPFEIWINQSETTVINANSLANLHQYFQNRLKQKLQPHFTVVKKATDKTLTIRGAFSGIKIKKPERSALDFIPIRIVLNAGKKAYLAATSQQNVITEVSIEAEFLLGTKGSRVFAMTATKQLDATIKKNGEDNFKALTRVLDIWINNFTQKLIDANK